MKFVDFIKKTWAWIVKAVQDVFHFVYTETGTIVSFFKTPDKSKFSSKRLVALALVANGLYMAHSAKGWFDVVLIGGQIIVGVVLIVVAAATKT